MSDLYELKPLDWVLKTDYDHEGCRYRVLVTQAADMRVAIELPGDDNPAYVTHHGSFRREFATEEAAKAYAWELHRGAMMRWVKPAAAARDQTRPSN